jgi:Do/DeqQ family serine protease
VIYYKKIYYFCGDKIQSKFLTKNLFKKMNRKNLLLLLAILFLCIATSFVTALIFSRLNKKFSISSANSTPTSFASLSNVTFEPTDFTVAAEKSVHSVVHVKTKYKIKGQRYGSFGNPFSDPFFDYFFGRPDSDRQAPEQEQMGSGSGVIISTDGYIVTNNHVIEKADKIEITLNDKRTFEAKIIGADPNTDIALLKVDATDLAPIAFGNSDNLKVGEWVLAVGNPFNLTSTVTAGIVSAKARNINILNAEMKIESFIQTDAAVNPGNSGGALVNIAGELVGINTAIASQTGNFAGYSFAVPITIVGKIVSDLKEFGVVQRAVLGIQIRDIDDAFAKEKKLETLDGAYVAGFSENSAAKEAGIKEGDIITEINGVKIKTVAQLQEQVGRYRPGDNIEVTINRKDKIQKLKIELKNRSGNTGIVKGNADMTEVLGVVFEPVNQQIARRFGLEGGIQVAKVTKGGAFANAGISAGFVIFKANNKNVSSPEDLETIYNEMLNSNADKYGLSNKSNVIFVSGLYPNGKVVHYIVNLK